MSRVLRNDGWSRRALLAAVAVLTLCAAACTSSSSARGSQTGTAAPDPGVAQRPAGSVALVTATAGAASSRTAANLTPIFFTDQSGNQVELDVEIASTEQQRELGLMNRPSMPEDQGMVFLWP